MVLNRGRFCPSRDMWHRLETFSVVRTGDVPLALRGKTSSAARHPSGLAQSPTTAVRPCMSVGWGEEPWFRVAQVMRSRVFAYHASTDFVKQWFFVLAKTQSQGVPWGKRHSPLEDSRLAVRVRGLGNVCRLGRGGCGASPQNHLENLYFST